MLKSELKIFERPQSIYVAQGYARPLVQCKVPIESGNHPRDIQQESTDDPKRIISIDCLYINYFGKNYKKNCLRAKLDFVLTSDVCCLSSTATVTSRPEPAPSLLSEITDR